MRQFTDNLAFITAGDLFSAMAATAVLGIGSWILVKLVQGAIDVCSNFSDRRAKGNDHE